MLFVCADVLLPANALSLSSAFCVVAKAVDVVEVQGHFFVGLNGFEDAVGLKHFV